MSDGACAKQKTIEIIVSEWMELIDASLAAQSISIKGRLIPACRLFVEHAIENFKSDDGKSNFSPEIRQAFLLSESFREFFVEILKWYEEKYGPTIRQKEPWELTGFIVFAGDTFEIKMPLTRDERLSETEIRLYFLNDLEYTDCPINWVQRPLDWSKFSDKQTEALDNNLRIVCRSLRKIRSELMTTNKPDASASALRTDVPDHLENAAEIVLRGRSYGLAIWDIHQSCEKMVKFILRQQRITYPLTHDVNNLIELLPEKHRKIVIQQDIQLIPSGKDAISYRYGEHSGLRLNQVFDIYKSALSFLAGCTDALETDHRLAGSSITLKKPAFFP